MYRTARSALYSALFIGNALSDVSGETSLRVFPTNGVAKRSYFAVVAWDFSGSDGNALIETECKIGAAFLRDTGKTRNRAAEGRHWLGVLRVPGPRPRGLLVLVYATESVKVDLGCGYGQIVCAVRSE